MNFINYGIKKYKDYSRKDVINALKEISIVRSFNNKNDFELINKKIKVVIVGTLTPEEGRKRGYFYTANKTKMYDILDSYFGNTNFTDYKHDFIDYKKLQEQIYSKGIAFMDIVDTAIVAPANSSEDADISYFNLDYSSFKKIKNDSIVFICNSKNSEAGFKEICIKLNKDKWFENHEYVKLFRGYQKREWDNILRKYL